MSGLQSNSGKTLALNGCNAARILKLLQFDKERSSPSHKKREAHEESTDFSADALHCCALVRITHRNINMAINGPARQHRQIVPRR